jgi:hypothetical protein
MTHTSHTLTTTDAYANGYSEPMGGNRLWRVIEDSADAAANWKAAQTDHAHTSYYGVEHIRNMRAYWLGRMRKARSLYRQVENGWTEQRWNES